ncbi:hypothetical protein D3C84_1106820 [compost metagenome]
MLNPDIAVSAVLNGCLFARALVMVAAKFASLPNAAASSLKVSSAAGDDAINALTAACTNAVFAN